MRIETARLLIRDVAPQDADPTAHVWSDPVVTRHLGGPRDPDRVRRSVLEDAARDPQPDLDLWSVIERESGDLVGNCGLLKKEIEGRAEVELVYVLARAAWGRGYATEAATAVRDHAFATLGISRVVALIEPGNEASARVAEKAGFTFECETRRPGGRTLRLFATTKR